jgi:hypothetical protein
MIVGGEDIVLLAPPDVPVADVILRQLRRHWPDAYFQDADREDYGPIDSPVVLIQGGRSREFFVFSNRTAAEAWHRDGATAENANSMLHFLIGPLGPRGMPRQVTMVCDDSNAEIERLSADLRGSFRGSRFTSRVA